MTVKMTMEEYEELKIYKQLYQHLLGVVKSSCAINDKTGVVLMINPKRIEEEVAKLEFGV